MKAIAFLALLAGVAFGKPNRFPDAGRLKYRKMAGCPCKDESLCKPIQGKRAKEVFGFSDGNYDWGELDWTRVTTIAWATGDEAMCTAHENNARIISGAIGLSTANLTQMTKNPTLIDKYVADTVSMVKAQYIDGVTFDLSPSMDAPFQET
eukprot:TRINITY_DN6975_c0_g3_i1.p1 TRINITY_DN6975_c0_g3~~TRINITY_DN6975_c0_g3_i1.p1  ORF type:complete len:172 (+),score=35.30 TRINITY_DN6975_c0_g3_i1:65-517(+)